MNRFAFAIAALLLLAGLSEGNYRHVHGNVYQYTPSGVYYSYYSPGYYQGCYYANGYYQQLYNYVPPASYTYNYSYPTTTVNLPPTPPANWKNLVIEEFGRIDDNRQYIQALRALQQAAGYPAPYAAPYGQYQNLNLSAYTQTGSTGYIQTNVVTDLGKFIDLEAADQRTMQFLAGLTTAADNSAKGREDLFARQQSLLERKLKTDAIIALAATINGPPTSTGIQANVQTGPAALPPIMPQPQQPPPTIQGESGASPLAMLSPQQIDVLWKASAQKCIGCHDEKSERQFKVALLDTYPDDFRAKILARIHGAAPEDKRMPRTKDGKAGQTLPESEYAIWRARLALRAK